MHIHNYNKCITITNIINFMHLYHGLIQVLILIQDSRRSYRTYAYTELILITDLYSFETPVGVIELMLIQNL